MDQVYHDVAVNLFRMTLTRVFNPDDLPDELRQMFIHQQLEQFGGVGPVEPPEGFPGGAEAAEPEEVPIQLPFHREEPKVGRNDPCPCGSGKKYKKCCGRNE